MSGLKHGKTGVPTRSFFLFDKIKGYRRFYMISYSLYQYDTTEVAKFRLKVINFHNQFGTKVTLAAFPVKRATIFLWKKKLKDNGGRLTALIPRSTKPHHLRESMVNWRIVAEVKKIRKRKYRPGKKKIKPLLDKFCQENELSSIAESTIGKVLQRNNYFKTKDGSTTRHSYHTATGKWERKKKSQTKKQRVRYHPKPKSFGYIQMDTITKFVDGVKRYIMAAIDVKLKFSFALIYPRLNSQNAKDFLIKFQEVYPLEIRTIQTDNGSEFQGAFDDYLAKQKIPHLFTYPRCPRINGTVERFNRTLQEDFINSHLHLIYEPRLFNEKMINYLLYYNGERPHESLGQISPLQYLVNNLLESNMCVARTRTEEDEKHR
jgi:transposase InsO family protein